MTAAARASHSQKATPPDNVTKDHACCGLLTAHYGVEVEVVLTAGKRCMVRVKRSSGHVVGDDVE
ncbi:MAG: hypothetical protein WA140_11565, partial [Geobacteraceae bacterium]